MTAVRVTESSGSFGTIQVSSGDGGFATGSLVAGSNVTITHNDSGSYTIAASTSGGSTIGAAEDGDYTDGLFTDFTSSTLIGISIDRFNEVLKALAPSPAPSLDDINSLQTGTTTSLSFGASNDQSAESPAYATVAGSAGIASAVDVNGSYTVTTSSNNIRLGVFNGSVHISGTLNDDVTANSQGGGIQNYPAFSFGDGEEGVLKLDVNGSFIKEIDLTTVLIGSGGSGLGTGSHLDSDGSGFNFFSQPTTGTFSNGNAFESFKHRTGKFVISSDSQRNGWNYARVQHVKGGSTSTTNYIEWVNDNNGDALAATGNSITFVGSGSTHLSGIEYFTSGGADYKVRVSNAYKYIYDTNAITFSTSTSAFGSSGTSFSISSQAKPAIGGGEDHTKVLHLTGSSSITTDYFLSGALTASVNVTHPLKSNLTTGGSTITSGLLIYDFDNTSTALSETFRRENYRIVSGAYETQSSAVDSSNKWDSNVHMTASNGGHSNGLQYFEGTLRYPTETMLSGDFRNTLDGGKLDNGPDDNPNYSGQTGKRTFYRWFKNETGSDKQDFSLSITTSESANTNIVSHNTALNSVRIRVFVKVPEKTGWLDISDDFVLGSLSDNNGGFASFSSSNTFDQLLNATNEITLGTVAVSNNEYVVIRIEADDSWLGNISGVTLSFGAGTGSITPVPDLDDIDCAVDGTDSNLSFGSSKSITGYTSVANTAGFGTAVDLNGFYETAASSNNLKRSVFALDTLITGDLNADVGSNTPDFTADAFSDANVGTLKLEVNGSVVHQFEITGSYNAVGAGVPGSESGNLFNSNGSGFVLSQWAPSRYDNGVPYYLEIYRTGQYRIATADQRNGWNYARVIHTVGGSDRQTNYVEWVNDNNANALSSAGVGLTAFGDDSFSYISGVKYFNSPTGSLISRISNVYKNVYSDSSSAISFSSLSNATGTKIIQSGSGLSSTKTTSSSTDSLQTLSTSTDSQNEVLHVSGTLSFSRSKSLPGTYTTAYNCAGAMTFVHPLKANHTISTQTATNMLVWTPSDTSNANTEEYFTGENYRLVADDFSAQSDVSGGSKNWNSQRSVNDQGSYPEHATGLLVYDTYLIPPKDGGASGDFRNPADGGSVQGPDSNPNYSTLTNATRDYYRSFLNNTTDDRPSVQITIRGDATIVGRAGLNVGTLGANKNIFVDVKIPGKTGFLDLGRPSAGSSGSPVDGDGCLSGDLDPTVDGSGATNTCTFNSPTADGTVSGAEYIIVRLSASKNWTGYIDRLSVSWSS